MPRRARCVIPGVPYHVTQRGVDRQATFSVDDDRDTYLRLLRDNLSEADVRVRAWCLMSNHVHLLLLPGREDSLSLLLRRAHGRYAQYYNTRWSRSGHLWQKPFLQLHFGNRASVGCVGLRRAKPGAGGDCGLRCRLPLVQRRRSPNWRGQFRIAGHALVAARRAEELE
jgi:REP element-mobilizing transposase RayT